MKWLSVSVNGHMYAKIYKRPWNHIPRIIFWCFVTFLLYPTEAETNSDKAQHKFPNDINARTLANFGH